MPKDCLLATHDFIRSEDIWGLPPIISRQTMVSNGFSGWLKRDYEKLNIVTTYSLIYNTSFIVEEGLEYILCLGRLVNTSESHRLCSRPLKPRMEARLDIVWKKYQVFSRTADRLLKNVRCALHSNI